MREKEKRRKNNSDLPHPPPPTPTTLTYTLIHTQIHFPTTFTPPHTLFTPPHTQTPKDSRPNHSHSPTRNSHPLTLPLTPNSRPLTLPFTPAHPHTLGLSALPHLVRKSELEAEVSNIVFRHVESVFLKDGDFAESLLLQIPELWQEKRGML